MLLLLRRYQVRMHFRPQGVICREIAFSQKMVLAAFTKVHIYVLNILRFFHPLEEFSWKERTLDLQTFI